MNTLNTIRQVKFMGQDTSSFTFPRRPIQKQSANHFRNEYFELARRELCMVHGTSLSCSLLCQSLQCQSSQGAQNTRRLSSPTTWETQESYLSLYKPRYAPRTPEGGGSQDSPSAHEGGMVVSPMHRLPLTSREYPWYSFLLRG